MTLSILKINHFIHQYFNAKWYKAPYRVGILSLLEVIYYIAMSSQLRMRRYSLSRMRKPKTVIWSITNLTVGGNAKTPMVMHVAKLANDYGIKVAILSRGYKRTRSLSRVCPDSSIVHDDSCVSIVGDEPKMMALAFDIPVYVVDDPARFLALYGSIADLWVVDDAWSRLRGWCHTIWMLDVHQKLGNAHMLPAGPLRFTTGQMCDPVYSNENVEGVACLYPRIIGFRDMSGVRYSVSQDRFRHAHVVTGIAKPDNVLNLLKSTICFEGGMTSFADHDAWPLSVTSKLDVVLITEKDAARLGYIADNIYIIELEYRANELLQVRLQNELSNDFTLRDS